MAELDLFPASVAPPAFAASPASTLSRFSFRGRPSAIRAVDRVLGSPLPRQACRAARSGDRVALWLGPDEWLLLAPEREGAALHTLLRAELEPCSHSLVDVTHRQLGFAVRGHRAAEVLNAGCPLDLDEAAFPIDACTRTVFGKAEVVLWRTDSSRFHLDVWRSFSGYVRDYLAEAAALLEV